ncbi:hypothetical protein A3D88_02160 [Candidatus Peribacteria bacterium RIFCSPHIGHO2_02_FULL_52_16]|nr:MAG: hypothetical protein A2706_02785 [Candidatus Peribacteria bacterium RIFCSPHIGHO2_01_FULL_51_35]OGJ61428.1 MAG: hypothetical protein A3D88_02160 [Candidatus Peribacteria bacterium RIFCSPHIGHO2_02_FULL_52_16]
MLARIGRTLRTRKGLIVLLLVIFFFYWFQIRPAVMYRSCAVQASVDARTLLKSKAELAKGTKEEKTYAQMAEKNMYLRSDYESFLKKCLLHYGLPEDALEVGKNVPAEEEQN